MEQIGVFDVVLILCVFIFQSHTVITSGFSQSTFLTTLVSGNTPVLESDYMYDDKVCPHGCKCHSYKNQIQIGCTVTNLATLVSFPNYTTSLNISGIQLGSLNSSLLYGFPGLKKLVVAHNELKYFNWRSFKFLLLLQVLDLSHNLLQGALSSDSFYGFEKLQVLDLSYNLLHTVSFSFFSKFKSLEMLYLNNNELVKIELDSFYKLDSLRLLDLSANNLSYLQHDWLKDLKNLQILKLNYNHIHNLSNVIFSSLNNLSTLDLSNNKIKYVGMLSFKGLKELKWLNLSKNEISFLHEDTLKSLENLEVLDISFNFLVSLDNLFKSSNSLKKLYLSNCLRLSKITKPMLTGLSNLKELHLANSSLSAIAKDAFTPLISIKVLNVMGSNLTTLHKGVFDFLSTLEILDLAGNPWHCDCYLYWLLQWLGDHTNTHLLNPFKTVCSSPQSQVHHTFLDALDKHIMCKNTTVQDHYYRVKYRVGSSAVLSCQAFGNPTPNLTWITPQNKVFHWSPQYENIDFLFKSRPLFGGYSYVSESTSDIPSYTKSDHFSLLRNGSLLINKIQRMGGGNFRCIASNPLNKEVVNIYITLDYEFLFNIKIISILVGFATSFGFLLLTLIVILVHVILKKSGVECIFPCGVTHFTKAQQIKHMLENMEGYRCQQLDRLQDHYYFQVQKIKDNCIQQIEKLRESYSLQTNRLRDICDYGTQQVDRFRDNYYQQVHRVRDYSSGQIDRLRENYVYQRNRIRKFSAHQLYKLRENYKLQQQHLNKILGNLNLENCRNVCTRTDSIMFEPEIMVETVFPPAVGNIVPVQLTHWYHRDHGDNSSQMSAYFTAEETRSQNSIQNDNRFCATLVKPNHSELCASALSKLCSKIHTENLTTDTVAKNAAKMPNDSLVTLVNEANNFPLLDVCKADTGGREHAIGLSLVPNQCLQRSLSLPETKF